MPAQDLAGELKKRSAWSIFMGVLTAALGVFLIAYPLATATITTVLLGWVLIFVGIALFVFALHSQTGRELLPEDSPEPALCNRRYRVGILSGRRSRGLDPDARNSIADSSRNAYCYSVPTETSGRLGLVFG
ncbi:MAG TPA: DUF308 domain-containing protein [Candidatus Sulfotelmatobacter sp.]|nr:DUF308 domain-containing protein [Candidatus Sulfotelmatobacter sp.]